MASEASGAARTMLLAFRAANVRSFRDPFEFSLEATAMAEPGVARSLPWRQDGSHPLRVLPAAGIFGANASGKTNFLRALAEMRHLVLTSFRAGDRSSPIDRHPFRLDPDCENAPSSYEIELVLDGIKHEYGFVIDSTKVISEYAIQYPRGSARTIFRRQGMDVQVGDGYRAKGRAVSEVLRQNSLYLSAAAAADHPGLLPLNEWFMSNLIFCDASGRPGRWADAVKLLGNEQRRSEVLSMLHAADLGITDARVRRPDPEMVANVQKIVKILQREMDFPEIPSPEADDLPFLGLLLSHRGTNGSVELESPDESLGTLVWLGLVGPVLHTLGTGTVLLADELESSLHPALVAQLVRTFQDPDTNPHGAQVVFNSFDVGLLGNSVEERVLGRDQVWFTEKLYDGRTRIYPLTDSNPRKAEAIGRRYLAGRYGATPIVSDAEFDILASKASAENLK